MRSWIVTLLAAVLVAACSEPGPPVPPQAMAALLADVHMAEVRATQVAPTPGRSLGERNLDTLVAWYGAVLTHHNMTQQRFKNAMTWYQSHPIELDSVYRQTVALTEQALADTARK